MGDLETGELSVHVLQTSSPFQGVLICASYHKGRLQGGLELDTTGGGALLKQIGAPDMGYWVGPGL